MKLKPFKILLSLLAILCYSGLAAQESTNENLPFMDYNRPKQYVLKDIKMIGLKTLTPETLMLTSGLNVGDTVEIPGQYITDATRKMWSQRLFSDIKTEVEFVDTDGAILYFYLTERPRVYNWSLTGVSKSEEKDLLEKLSLRPGTELSDFRITSSINAIQTYFYGKSFLNAYVDVEQTSDTTRDNAINVNFAVNKGPKVKIGKIEFAGNEVFRDKTLRRAFKKTKQKSLNIFANTKFNEEKYEEDKENLIDFYNSKGYRNSTVVADSIYTINEKRIGIKVNVDEGDKFYYRNVTWVGNSKLSSDELDRLLGVNEGDTYDNKTVNKRLGVGKEINYEDETSITSIYQNDGYLTFNIVAEENVVGADSVDLEMKIFEGEQFTINRIAITGNERVNDQVVRREISMYPAELYNRSMLMGTLRYIAGMGFFNPEGMNPDFDIISDDLVDITFQLEEQPSDRFEISGGVGAGMFVGAIGVEFNNISMGDFFKKGAWRPFPVGAGQQLAIRAQSNGSYYKAASVSFTEPWLGGRKPVSLTTSFYYSDQTNAYYMWQSGTKRFSTIGGSIGLGRRLKWPDMYFQLYNELMYQSYRLKDWDSFIISNGNSNIIALKTMLTRSTVDQPTYPRSGSEFSLSVTLTPPYSLFDGHDYKSSELSDNDRYRWIEYHKWQFKTQWYFPLDANGKWVLMAKAEMGFIGDYNKYKPSPFEGYEMGGDGMSGYNLYGVDVIGMRGYENGSLTPNNQYSRAYNKYTMELRYPFILKPSSVIYGLIFAEGGNAFADFKSFDPFLLKRSLGFGLRVFIPIVGMLGVDWGYGFDRTVDTKERGGGQVAFTIGQQF